MFSWGPERESTLFPLRLAPLKQRIIKARHVAIGEGVIRPQHPTEERQYRSSNDKADQDYGSSLRVGEPHWCTPYRENRFE